MQTVTCIETVNGTIIFVGFLILFYTIRHLSRYYTDNLQLRSVWKFKSERLSKFRLSKLFWEWITGYIFFKILSFHKPLVTCFPSENYSIFSWGIFNKTRIVPLQRMIENKRMEPHHSSSLPHSRWHTLT